jgi:hypothetical protein
VVTFLITTGYSFARTLRPLQVAAHLGEIIAAGAYSIGAMWLVQFVVGDGDGLVADTALALGKLAAFLVLMTPWFFLAERRVKAISMMVGMVRPVVRKLHKRLG